MHAHLNARARAVLFVCLLAASTGCGGDKLNDLVPVLAARDGSTADASGKAQYLVDFGEVVVGGDARQTFYIRNKGRATMTVSAPTVAAPFSAPEFTADLSVPLQEERPIIFQYAPTAEGTNETIVTLDSDGGSLTIRLTGRARAPLPTDCSFDLGPTALDFGSVPVGQSKTLSFRLVNKGANPCNVTHLSLAPSSSSAFTIEGGAIASKTIAAYADLTVNVIFAPTVFAPTYAGQVQFLIGPPDKAEQIALSGGSPAPCPGVLPDGTCPVATDPIYVNDADHLFTWDAAANTLKRIGSFPVSVGGMTDIAIDTNGVMMGVGQNQGLYVIDPQNANCTLIGHIANVANGLTFLPDGRLVASGAGVWAIDKTNGQTTQTIVAPGKYETSGDIIGLPDAKLYWAVKGSGNDDLVQIDPASGQTTVIGSLGTTGVYGLAYEAGSLYGYVSGGRVITIRPADAHVSQTRTLAGSWWGATTNPVLWNQ